MTIFPKYEPYWIRSFRSVRTALFIVIILLFFSLIIHASLITTIIFTSFTILTIVYSLYTNKYYLYKVEIDNEHNEVKYSIYIFDRLLKENKCELKKFDIEVKEIFLTKSPQYKLILKCENEIIFKQRQTGNWTKEQFKEMITNFKLLQGKTPLTNYIR